MLSLIIIGMGTVFAWGAFLYILARVDPFISGTVLHILLYVSMGIALQGTLMLAAIFWRKRRTGIMASRDAVLVIARQAALAIGFIIVSLYVSSRGLLRWWSVLPLAIFTFLIELFFTSIKRGHTHTTPHTTRYVSK